MTQATYVIIGTSAAGLGAAYRLRMLGTAARIICLSYEQHFPYNKCLIVDYLSNTCPKNAVTTLSLEGAQAKNIELMLGTHVLSINTTEKYLECSDETFIAYDALFIGTGCTPFIPSIQGSDDCAGIFTFYHLSDVDALRTYIKERTVKTAVIIGAGLTGLEAADGLHAHGIAVTVVERGTQVLPRHVDQRGSGLIQQYMMAAGVKLCLNASVEQVKQNNGVVTAVVLKDGRHIQADLIIYAVGADANTDFAKKSGIALRNGYIDVDSSMRTNIREIYAGGDCAVLPGCSSPSFTWPEAMQQGMHAAYNMMGQHKPYMARPIVISSAFFGVKFASSGLITVPHANKDDYIVKTTLGDGFYHCYLYHNNRLKGFVLIGNTQPLAQLRRDIII